MFDLDRDLARRIRGTFQRKGDPAKLAEIPIRGGFQQHMGDVVIAVVLVRLLLHDGHVELILKLAP